VRWQIVPAPVNEDLILKHERLAILVAALAAANLGVVATSAAATIPQQRSLDARIATLMAEFPAVERGRTGFQFIDLTNGTVLAERNAAEFFTPASNAKLYTTALGLVRLGLNYQFQTELRTTGPWRPGQATLTDLQLVGGGDPNLSGRVLPYAPDAKPGDALTPLRDLAKKLSDAGVNTITGDVAGVATRYPGDLYPDGWTIDDSIYDYGAPVSSLTFNDNSVSLKVYPSESGELANIETQPAVNPLLFLNQVITDDSDQAHVHVVRSPATNEVVLWGTIGTRAHAWEEDLAVTDPAAWTASALIAVLREQGITVRGQAVSQYESLNELGEGAETNHSGPAGTLLAVHQSAPLFEDITVTNKVSQNLHAEMLLREVGYVVHGIGTLSAGVDERTKFLNELGITPDGTGLALTDGSGLARQDLTTPESTVTLLRAMWDRPERETWIASLPIGGVDGTLEHRFKKIPGAARVHAKTGSIAHVNSLSGYIETKDHGWLAFSIMVNGTTAHDSEVRTFIDRLCALFIGD